MLTDSLVEDGDYMYYVNANGAMVTNSWVAVEPGADDYDDNAPDHYWYYFGSNGKAYKQTGDKVSIKTINGKKYGFDTDSRMVYGFVQEDGTKNQDENPFVDAMYYFGTEDDGAMHTDWLQYMDGSDETTMVNGEDRDYADMDEMWFYFKPSNGQMVKADAGELKTQTVRGNKYGFDEKGVMVYDWNETIASSATSSNVKYFSEDTDGHLQKKTWIYAVPTESMDEDDYNDDQQRWFYADSTGTTAKNEIKKINGKKYLFNEDGIMQSGLQWVDVTNGVGDVTIDTSDDITDTSDQIKNYNEDGTKDGYKLYFFSDNEESDGSMKTGKNIKIELDDDTFTFAFKNNGQAYNTADDGLIDKKIYVNGILIKADSDMKYVPYGAEYSVEDDEYAVEAYRYLVGTSGTTVSNKKYVKDGDDNWWSVYNNVATNWGAEDYSKDLARCAAKGQTGEVTPNEDGEYEVDCK